MSQEVASLSEAPGNFTVIQVDKEISFVLDSRDASFQDILPSDKSVGSGRKTYSKRHPISYNPCVSFSDDSITVMSNTSRGKKPLPLKNSPKSPLNSTQGPRKGRRKRPADSEPDSPVSRKGRKKDVSARSIPTTKMNGRIAYNFKNKSSKSALTSPESDIQILNIIEPGTSKSGLFNQNLNGSGSRLEDISHRKNSTNPLVGILKRTCSYPSNYDVPVTEVDTAPIMTSYSGIPNTVLGESTNDVPSSMKWLSANGTIAFSPMQNGSCSAKESALKYADKYNLYIPEMKITENEESEPERVPKTKRELKNLFENLNEISWANEKSFKQMLSGSDGRHSERITAKVTETGKTLRRIKAGAMKNLNITSTKRKPGPAKRNSAKLVQRAKYGKPKPRLLVKPIPRHKVPFNKVKKITKPVGRPKKSIKSIAKHNKIKVIKKTVTEANKVKMLKKSAVKPSKINVIKKSITKRNKLTESKTVTKPIKSILKSSKELLKDVPPKNGPKAKSAIVQKEKALASASSSKDNCATYNSCQNHSGNCSHTASNGGLFSAFGKNFFKPETFVNFKDPCFVKELKNFEACNELENIRSVADNNMMALNERSKPCEVRVKPSEHAIFWDVDFYEDFKKHILEQAFLKTFESRDHESINTMFQELQEACFNPPSNVKPLKKKKPEEECLRSSVRQSECAFRYKEIVVKKHDNYMQFVLVPNSCKRNSLTIEAMKELRDAFLLAKKDPNCRAVLLNSSGTYFCTGIDLSLLVGNNKKQVAEEMASTVRDLVLTLSTFTKPVIAAVNGTAVGFGVSLLTYCDVVLASDKATFCIPATRLGYLPEGAITLTLPQVVGSGVATEMLLYGRRLTAEQALRHGLVSEVLWPTQLMNEVVPRIQTIVSQPLQVMEATKTMVRCHLWDKLKTHIEREWRLLPSLWLDAQCQHNIKRTLQTGWLVD